MSLIQDFEEAGVPLHVIPVNDLREHDADHGADCWCKPTPDDEYPEVLVHHSMDRREEYEQGRKLH